MRLAYLTCFVYLSLIKSSTSVPVVNFSSIKFINKIRVDLLSEAEKKILNLLFAAIKFNLFMCSYGPKLDCYIEMFFLFPTKENYKYFLKLRTELKDSPDNNRVLKFTFTNLKKDMAFSGFINFFDLGEEMIIQIAESLSEKVLNRFSAAFRPKRCSVFDNGKFFIDNFKEVLFTDNDDNNISKKEFSKNLSKDPKESSKDSFQNNFCDGDDHSGSEAYCENNFATTHIKSQNDQVLNLEQNDVKEYLKNAFNSGYVLASKKL